MKAVSASGWTLKALPQMTDQQFTLWRELLEKRTGIFVTENRKSFLQASLMQRMREQSCEDYQVYYEKITQGPMGNIEWARLIDSLTVQETRFFRDSSAFKFVEKYIEQNQGFFNKKNPLDIWSVGCSSGEEVYSLAITAQQILGQHNKTNDFIVTGTDISVPVLNKARKGIYSQRRVELLDQSYIDSYFEKLSTDQYEVIEAIKRNTCFAQVNVMDLDKVAQTPRHIIYCQNLLIYFRRERRQEILNQLVERLAPGGLLLIGMGEMVDWIHPKLESIKGEFITAFIKTKI